MLKSKSFPCEQVKDTGDYSSAYVSESRMIQGKCGLSYKEIIPRFDFLVSISDEQKHVLSLEDLGGSATGRSPGPFMAVTNSEIRPNG